MKVWIKKKITNVIESYINSEYRENNKWEIKVGSGSFFELPLKIEGGQKIKIGDNSSIGRMGWLATYTKYLGDENFTPEIVIGNNVRIGNFACITSIDKIVIGDGCLFSEYVYISDHGHSFDPINHLPPVKQELFSKGPVLIGENCFIGFRVSILPGVTIGKNCVIGSHSVVTTSFPDYTMIAGVPAIAIKKFNFVSKEWEKLNNI